MKIALWSFAHTHALGYVFALAHRPGVELVTSDPDHVRRHELHHRRRSLRPWRMAVSSPSPQLQKFPGQRIESSVLPYIMSITCETARNSFL